MNTSTSPQTLTGPRPRRLLEPWLAAGVIAAAVTAAYGNTFSVPFLYDDTTAIESNPTIRHLGAALWPAIRGTVAGRPVLNLSLAVNYAIGGTAVWGYHALNLAIHILAAIALFGILRRTCAPREGEGPGAAIAFSGALLWALHPLQTQAVTYVVQRAESLMGLFYLLTLYGFIRGAGTDGRRRSFWFCLSFAACLLGMGTKEVMVSAPLIVLLYDRTFLSGGFREAWRRHGKMLAALMATWGFLVFLLVAMPRRNEAVGLETAFVRSRYALTQLHAIAHYLRLCFWPRPLVFDYGTELDVPSLRILPSAFLVIGLAVVTLWALVRRPPLGFLGAFFFAVLAPSSSILPIAGEIMADYRMYLPSIPVAVLVAWGIGRLGRAGFAVCLLLAALLGASTSLRNRDYRSVESIWNDAAAKLPGNPRALNNLGVALAESPGRLPQAIAEYEAALRLDPDFADARNNLGSALANLPGRLPEAIIQFEAALKLKPGDAKAHDNLALALEKIPDRLPEAVDHFEEAVRIDPGFAEAHDNLGVALAHLPGRLPEAIAHYEAALKLDPGYAEAHYNLGLAYARMPGRLADAMAHFEAALRTHPDFAEAHYNLGVACAQIPGRLPDAIAHYEAALRIDPDFADAHYNLAAAYAKTPGGLPKAIAHYRAVLKLNPDDAQARASLDKALAPLGVSAGVPGP